MLRILAAALFALSFALSGVGGANAQQATPIASCGSLPTTLTLGIPHVLYMDVNGVLCTSSSGGGLSVTDQAAFTAGTSAFTPSGGVFNDSATLTSGQQGTYRLTTKRAQIVDVDTSGNALYSALTASIPAGTNIIGKVGIDQTTPGTTNLVAAGQNGTWTVQPGNTVNTTPWLMTETPGTTGGLTNYFVQPTASDNHAVIKNGAGQVYHVSVTNNSATVNYLRLYNAGTGFNGCNSATNLVGQWAIPASTSIGGITFPFFGGLAFSTGISICVTSGYATTDTTNATASAMSVNVGYK